MELVEKIKITNSTGLHARPASQFVQKASKFKSNIEIIHGNKEVNAKSIMGVLTLGISKGKKITLKAEGEDEEKAIKELTEFIEIEMPKEDE